MCDDGNDEDRVFYMLDKVERVLRERGERYGDPRMSFGQVAKAWSALLAPKLTEDVTAAEVALCMDALKSVRLTHTPDHYDSEVDKVGYTVLHDVLKGDSNE